MAINPLAQDLLNALMANETQGEAPLPEYRDNPVGFAKEIIGIEPTYQQEAILNAVQDDGHVSVRSGHGIGKSAVLALITLWFLFTRTFAKIPVTAPSSHQLFDVYWGELIRWFRQIPVKYSKYFEYTTEKLYHREYRESWAVFPRTARPEKPEALQGFHGENLMFIVDEAAGVDERIFQVAEGAITAAENRVVLTGNPTRLSGFFYDSHHKDRAAWKSLHYSSLDSPLVDASFGERMSAKYGESSNTFLARVLGEFPVSEEDQFLPLDMVEAAVDREVPEGYQTIYGLDVSRFGGDRTVLCRRNGLRVEIIGTVRGMDLMSICGWVINHLGQGNRSPIHVDSIGLGAGVSDRLREQGYRAIDVATSEKPSDRSKYVNLRAELWDELKTWLKEGSIPDNPELISELSAIKYSFDSSGRLVIEKKSDMKKRGLPSPDLADSVVLTFKKGFFSDIFL